MINTIDMAIPISSKNLFIGFSTVGDRKDQTLKDIELVKQDLLNHFNTRKNERVMMPGWGCGIWDLLFEPINLARENIIYEAQRIVESDPRVQLRNISVTEMDHGVKVEMELLYVPLDAIGTFAVDFDRRSQQMS